MVSLNSFIFKNVYVISQFNLPFKPFLSYRSTQQPEFNAFNYVVRSPVGIAGLITPWNLPLYLLSFKIAPAIASGCCVIVKPSEMTSVTAWMLCEVLNQAGMIFSWFMSIVIYMIVYLN